MAKATDTNEVDLAGIVMPAGTPLPGNATSSLMVGNHYSTGMSVSGPVRRITMNQQTGVITLWVEPVGSDVRRVFLWPTGMLSEAKE